MELYDKGSGCALYPVIAVTVQRSYQCGSVRNAEVELLGQ